VWVKLPQSKGPHTARMRARERGSAQTRPCACPFCAHLRTLASVLSRHVLLPNGRHACKARGAARSLASQRGAVALAIGGPQKEARAPFAQPGAVIAEEYSTMSKDEHAPGVGPSLVTYNFDGDPLDVVTEKTDAHVVIRRVCEALGINTSSQIQRLKKDPATCVVIITMQLPGDTQKRDLACIGLRALPLWLAKVHPSKVRPELRAKLIRYQREAAEVLADHCLTLGGLKPLPSR